MISQQWENLSGKHRRLIVVGSVVLVFGSIVAMLPDGKDDTKSKAANPEVRAILTDRDNGNVRYERLHAQLENVRGENTALNRDIDTMRKEMGRLEAGQIGHELAREIKVMGETIARLEDEQKALREKARRDESQAKSDLDPYADPGTDTESPADAGEAEPGSDPVVMDEPGTPSSQGAEAQAAAMWKPVAPSARPALERNSSGATEGDEGAEAPVTQTAIRIIGEEAAPEEEVDQSDLDMYLPAGSIMTGTLISGMDAPTGQNARKEPFPALLRLKHDAILPNRFRADVRECFVIVGGYGDLSSERAYLRGETISCVKNDGSVIESRIESYTVGEDGKAGLRGRLVSKQGQILAKAMAAGVMEGFASAFNRSPVPTLSLNGGDKQLYQQAFSSDAVQSGGVSGVGSALDRLAKTYIEQADAMYPVIEVDAGRQVEIVLIRGVKLAMLSEGLN